MPGTCHLAGTARTKAGRVELYAAVDARDRAATPAMIRRGEYRAGYVLILPDRTVTEPFEEGGMPTVHPYEQCGATGTWCERTASSTPSLLVDRADRVTLVVRTVTLEQRWADLRSTARGTVQEQHVRVRTVRCVKDADGWSCASRASAR